MIQVIKMKVFQSASVPEATWPFGKFPLPLVAFRDLLADPLPPPNWLRGFWMPHNKTVWLY